MRQFSINKDYHEILKIIKHGLKFNSNEDSIQEVLLEIINLKTPENIPLKEIYKAINRVSSRIKYNAEKEKVCISLDDVDNQEMVNQLTYENYNVYQTKARGSILLTCPKCQKQFKRYMSELSRTKTTFCSCRCRELYRQQYNNTKTA